MVEIKSNNYSVFVVKGIAKELKRFFNANKNKYSKLFILVDENSLKYCYPQLVEQVEAFEDAEIIEIESGEESKNLEICSQIWTTLSEYGADRQSLLINIGGGVIGDLGGFVASTFKRGIGFINIPTTLLSQVDASIGGKVGIDLNYLKNEIGLFNSPLAVYVDTSFLVTLDKRQILSGFAEMIKHALIADKVYWNQIFHVDFSDFNNFDSFVESSIRIKNDIVKADLLEKNIRKKLNFGHTIGHAIETFYLEHNSQQTLLHGEAVAIGMVCEAYISNKITELSDDELKQITQFIIAKFKHIRIEEKNLQQLIELMKHDKKNDKGEINFSLLSAIGKCEINKTVKTDLIKESLKYYTEQAKGNKKNLNLS